MNDLEETLKLQAQIHAQEARTANATIAEIYRLCSGGAGESGNWHGAEPVRIEFERLHSEIAALRMDVARAEAQRDALSAELAQS